MLKLFHELDLPKSGIVVMQLFVCGCVSYPWSAVIYHFNILTINCSEIVNGTTPEDGKLLPKHVA
jgi:hypothetical protein